MKKNSDNSPKTELRQQAEAKLSERKRKAVALPATELETQRLIHELEVHQIELEMQNEELVQSRAQVEAGLLQYTNLYDFAPIGYFTLACDGTIHQVNLAGASLLGIDRSALIKRRFGAFVSTESRSVFNAFLEKVFGSQQKGTCEVRFQNNGSALLWVHLEATISIVSRGESEACRVVVVDIAERKRGEKALQESEERFRQFFEYETNYCYRISTEGTILDLNPCALRALGYASKDEIVGKPLVTTVYAPNSRDRARQLFLRWKETGELHYEELSIISKTGEERIIILNVSAVRDAEGKMLHSVSIQTDITERKQAEEALRKSEVKLVDAMKIAKLGNWEYDVVNDQFTFNDQFYSLFHTTADREGGYCMSSAQYAQKFVHPDDMALVGSETQKALETTDPDYYMQLEHRIIGSDGKIGHIAVRIRIEKDAKGRTVKTFGVNQDITEQKTMEEGLRQMQKLEGLGTLAGGIAHDFNNILGIILAYITSLKRFKDDTKKLDLAVATITKAVDRGKTLVQQILTFARKTETIFGAVDVNDIVMEIMTMIYETFPKVITYSQNFDKTIHYINADRSQLHQALLNLCVNARDAMPSGGMLTINTRMVSVASLRNQHPEASASGYACIEVSDTGEGMTPEIQKRIFEPFFTTKGIGKGTGLGLAVVFGVAQTHKGFIDVESELGKGTTFRLYLPASQAAVPVIEKDEQTLEEMPGGTETLLVVEDEETLLMSLRMVLEEKGYTVLSVGDGLEAVDIFKERKKKIALVLTDLGLPNMTGLEVSQRIKKINPKENIILATGFLDPEMKAEFLKAGIEHFLYKPYDLRKVLKVIREVLDGK